MRQSNERGELARDGQQSCHEESSLLRVGCIRVQAVGTLDDGFSPHALCLLRAVAERAQPCRHVELGIGDKGEQCELLSRLLSPWTYDGSNERCLLT